MGVFSLPRLKERSWQLAGTLSGGEQQMLAVARALMSHPQVIMMDEPSLGLAPLVVKGIFDIIREINKNGTTVLLIEQNANMALKAANDAYVLETGSITLSGTGGAARKRAGQKGLPRQLIQSFYTDGYPLFGYPSVFTLSIACGKIICKIQLSE